MGSVTAFLPVPVSQSVAFIKGLFRSGGPARGGPPCASASTGWGVVAEKSKQPSADINQGCSNDQGNKDILHIFFKQEVGRGLGLPKPRGKKRELRAESQECFLL
jgi:hypothetical protein